MGTLFDRALAAILVLLRAPRCDCSVGVITTTDCRSADPDTFREFGTQLSASMVMLMRMRAIFPDWAGYLVTNRESWRHPNCEAAWQDLSGLYREKFRDDVKLVHFHVHHFKFLEIFAKVPGKETDHSRGHWPVEAYVHLVIGARLLEEYGHDHTVYVDPDAYTGRRVRDRFRHRCTCRALARAPRRSSSGAAAVRLAERSCCLPFSSLPSQGGQPNDMEL